jgi:hypothetical protein
VRACARTDISWQKQSRRRAIAVPADIEPLAKRLIALTYRAVGCVRACVAGGDKRACVCRQGAHESVVGTPTSFDVRSRVDRVRAARVSVRAWLRAADGALRPMHVTLLKSRDDAAVGSSCSAADSIAAPAFRCSYELAEPGLYSIVIRASVDDDIGERSRRRQSRVDDEASDAGELVSGAPCVVRVRSDRAPPTSIALALVEFSDLLLRLAKPHITGDSSSSARDSDETLTLDADRVLPRLQALGLRVPALLDARTIPVAAKWRHVRSVLWCVLALSHAQCS